MTRVFAALTAAVLLSVLTSALLNRYTSVLTEQWAWSLAWLSLVFLILGIIYKKRNSPAELVPALIGGFVARFLAGLVFLLAAFLVHREGFFPLALHYLLHWLLFTVAEIAYLSVTVTKKPRS